MLRTRWLLLALAVAGVGLVVVFLQYIYRANQREPKGRAGAPIPVKWTYNREQLARAVEATNGRKGQREYRALYHLFYQADVLIHYKDICSGCATLQVEGMTVAENDALANRMVYRFFNAEGTQVLTNPVQVPPPEEQRFSIPALRLINSALATVVGFVLSIVIVRVISDQLLRRAPGYRLLIKSLSWLIIGVWGLFALMAVTEVLLR